MNYLTRLTMRALRIRLLNQAFLPARRKSAEEMLFRRSVLWSIWMALGSALSWVGLYASFTDEAALESAEDIVFLRYTLAALALIFTAIMFESISYKAVAGPSSITVRYGVKTKMIRYSEIERVEHSTVYGGYLVLRSADSVVRIPDGARGIAEFIQRLSDEIGDERCSKAFRVLNNKKIEIMQLS